MLIECIESGREMAAELKRTLGLFDASAIGIGAIIGSGIFVVTGIAAGLAGPALLISLIIGAFISGFTALSFAELAQSMPEEGGGYKFAHELISPFAGFISEWLWILSNLVAGVVVSLGFASYLSLFLPYHVNVNLLAALACLGITFINYLGARDSSFINDILVILKLLILAFFVVFGLGAVKLENFSPFIPNGGIGIMQGATLIFFAYSGFARITLVSEEVRDPKKNIPLAIILALGISTVVYMLVSFTAVGLVGYKALASSGSPLADAASSVGRNLTYFVSVGALFATLSVLLTTLLGLSRISFAMARERDLPQLFTRLDKRATPYYTVLVFGFTMALLSLFTNHRVSQFRLIAVLSYYQLCCAETGRACVSPDNSRSWNNNLYSFTAFPYKGSLDNRLYSSFGRLCILLSYEKAAKIQVFALSRGS